MAGDSYLWSGLTAGSWDDPNQWVDTTKDQTPAAVAPGSNDAVTFNGLSGGLTQIVSGVGAAASVTIDGALAFTGQVTTGALSLPGSLILGSGASLIDSGDAASLGSVQVSGGTLSIAGTVSGGGNVSSTSGGFVRIGAIGGNNYFNFYVDGSSRFEIGSGNDAVVGGFVVDSGVSISSIIDGRASTFINNGFIANIEDGDGDIFENNGTIATNSSMILYYGEINNNGSINDNGRVDLEGTVGGTGQIDIGVKSTLHVGGTIGSGQTIDLTGSGALLQIGSQDVTDPSTQNDIIRPYAINGAISGFSASDAILVNAAVTNATWAGNVLTIYNGAAIVDTLNLVGNYAGAQFVAIQGGQISELSTGDTVSAPTGTATPDSYLWSGLTAGSWDDPNQWVDTTKDQTPAAVAPGSNDAVTFNGLSGGLTQIVSGVGAAASVTIGGALAFTGQVTTGALSLPGSLILGSGASLIDSGDAASLGSVQVSGGTLSIAGTVSGGGNVSSTSGGFVRIGAIGGNNYFNFYVDGSSRFEIGSGNDAVVGGFVVDSGVSISSIIDGRASTFINNGFIANIEDGDGDIFENNGTIATNSSMILYYGEINNNGSINDNGRVDLEGTVGGTGQIDIGVKSTLHVGGTIGSGQTIDLTGSGALLQIGSQDVTDPSTQNDIIRPYAINGAISGFSASDAILVNAAVTNATWAGNVLTIYNGAAIVDTLNLVGNYAGAQFVAIQGGQISELSTGDTVSAPTGTATPDSYLWSGLTAGSWDDPNQWVDTTKDQTPAAVAPGSNDAVTFNGLSGGLTQIVSGVGAAASVTIGGALAFTGQVTTGALSLPGSLILGSGASLIDSGDAASLGSVQVSGGTLSIAGTVSGGGNVSSTSGGFVRIGAIGGNNYFNFYVDGSSRFEIGSGNDAVVGGFVVDSGVSISSIIDGRASTFINNGFIANIEDGDGDIFENNGTIATNSSMILYYGEINNNGSINDNGRVDLEGTVGGTGQIDIGVKSTLHVGGTIGSGQTIDLTGSGALLQIGSQDVTDPSTQNDIIRPYAINGAISGFSASDAILVNAAATNATWAGNVLTIYNGAAIVDTLNLVGNYAGAQFVAIQGGQISFTGLTPPSLLNAGASTYDASGTAVAINGSLSLADSESAQLVSARVEITSGFLAGDELNFTNQNGIASSYNTSAGVLTLSGAASLAAYQAALESITFLSTAVDPRGGGSDPSRSVTLTIYDGTQVSNALVDTVTVNDPPTIAGTAAGQATTSEAAIKPFAKVTISDANANASESLTITVGGTGGTLSGAGLVGGAGGVYTLSGSAATVTSELDVLSFVSTPGRANSASTSTFLLSDLSNAYGTPTVDAMTTVVDYDPAVAPMINGTVAGQTTTSEAAIKPFATVTISDANANASELLTITIGGTGGTLSGAGLIGGAGGVYTLSGSAATVTSELDALSFTPTPGQANSVSMSSFALSDLSGVYATPAVNSMTTVVDIDPAVTITWKGASSINHKGAWNTAADWTPAIVPLLGDTVAITAIGAYTVSVARNNTVGNLMITNASATLAIAAGDILSLTGPSTSTSTGTITIAAGGTLTVSPAFGNNGKITLSSATVGSIVAGAVLTNGAATVSGTISGTGTIGDSDLAIVNQNKGVINGNGATALTLDAAAATIDNTGLIEATGVGGLVIDGALANSGRVTLSTTVATQIGGGVVGSVLTNGTTNVAGMISGAGTVGGANLAIVNQTAGTIDANGATVLTLNATAAAIANTGLIESSAAGGLTIKGAVTNTGQLLAFKGLLLVIGPVTGTGIGEIGAGTLDLAGSFDENVTFLFGSTGTLELANSQAYTAQVSGFSLKGKNALDLADIKFAIGATTETYSGTTAGGVLTVTDGSHTAKIGLVGNFTKSTFALSSDGHGGTRVVDPVDAAASPSVNVSALHQFIAAAAGFSGGTAASLAFGQANWREAAESLTLPHSLAA